MKRKIIYALSVLAIIGIIVFYYLYDPNDSLFFPKCPFKLLTGWDCPSCGGQRAMHAALHGHLAEAVMLNPFFLLAIPVLVFVIIVQIIVHGKSIELTSRQYRLLKIRNIVVKFYIVAYIIWFILRNVLKQ